MDRIDIDVSNGQRHRIIGTSEALRSAVRTAERLATKNCSVVISGESGTGKELIARAIHYRGNRSSHPFVAVNCGAIPSELFESEMFGHERGSFTSACFQRIGYLEAAGKGTLFLDEIGEMSLPMQVKLLRALQESRFSRVGSCRELPFEARVVVASNHDLAGLVRQGKFREELFWRLKVVTIDLPPLRRRPEDIPVLVEYILHYFNAGDVQVSEDAMNKLVFHGWPGNVRELANVVERALVHREDDDAPWTIEEDHVNFDSIEEGGQDPLRAGYSTNPTAYEREYLTHHILRFKGSQTKLAEHMKTSVRSIRHMLDKHGLRSFAREQRLSE